MFNFVKLIYLTYHKNTLHLDTFYRQAHKPDVSKSEGTSPKSNFRETLKSVSGFHAVTYERRSRSDVHHKAEFIRLDVSDSYRHQLYWFCDKTPTSASSRVVNAMESEPRSHPMIINCKKSRRFNVQFMGTSWDPYKAQDARRYIAL